MTIFCIQILFAVIANERSECGNPTNILIYMAFSDHPTYAEASPAFPKPMA
jgi:hypothetical protein